MVDEWCGSFVSLPVELDQHPLDVEQITINGIQEPSRLQVLRRSTTRIDRYQSKEVERGGGPNLLT